MSRPFNEDLFRNRLRTSWIGSEFIHFNEVGSTSSWLKSIPTERFVHGMVVNTGHQTSGRGQHARSWISDKEKNLSFSVGFKPPSAERLPLLTMAAAGAVAEELCQHTGEKIHLKWPNDVLAGNKKIAGILTECIFLGSNPDRVVLGIGVNVGQAQFPDQLSQSAVSLAQISKNVPPLESLLAGFLSRIEQAYMHWHKRDTKLHVELSKNLEGYGEWVRLQVDGEIKEGLYKFLGIGENGELLALNEDLDVNTFTHEQIRIITGR
jgi:BirA family transcriptional regulator, biotin operon repressor / biotin---[acetyl-CoA-carboxylase] ligase